MQASELMVPEIFVVGADETIAAAKNLFIKHHISRLLVMENDEVAGILTEQDLVDAFTKARDPVDTMPIRKLMREGVPTVEPNESVPDVAKKILDSKCGCTVVEDNGVIGIITKTDLVRFFAEHNAGQMTVSDIMSADVHTITLGHSMFRASRKMEDNKISRLVVVDGSPIGIVTSRDIALASFGQEPKRLVLHRDKGRSTRLVPLTVSDIMKTDLATIPPKSGATSAAKLMLEKSIGSIIVVDRDGLKGIVTKTDIARALLEE